MGHSRDSRKVRERHVTKVPGTDARARRPGHSSTLCHALAVALTHVCLRRGSVPRGLKNKVLPSSQHPGQMAVCARSVPLVS